ncbi:MAG: acetyl-CoA carboxylase biotin carboxyl carrier protein [Candidatus Anammoximicrobium sp.]|nr:acetyl-CoA carboxylase biotin carboxyl carrier protein [Candidatus Anammoximicrobium sp.]
MADSEARPDDIFELDRIRSLIELMKEHDLSEIDLRQAQQRIRLCRGSAADPQTFSLPPPPSPAVLSPNAPAAATAEDANIQYIKSPMVGTFYSKSNPNAEPYVRVGDHVDAASTVCIIEAMKVFNEIPAEVSGRIVAVLVDDEEAVEFGRPLFKLDTKK